MLCPEKFRSSKEQGVVDRAKTPSVHFSTRLCGRVLPGNIDEQCVVLFEALEEHLELGIPLLMIATLCLYFIDTKTESQIMQRRKHCRNRKNKARYQGKICRCLLRKLKSG